MRKIFILMLVCLVHQVNAQTAATYAFARTTGAPATITGGTGTVVTTGFASDELVQAGIPIGFSFVYCGTAYTTLSASSNGWLSLANYSASAIYTNSAGNIPSAGFLMPFWFDLDGSGANGYYQTSGTAPNRVFTIQWGQPAPAAQRWGNFGGGGRACFQARLYESSNIVEFNYLFSNYSGATAGTVGIANSTSDYRTLPTITSTTTNTSFTANLANAPAANSVLDFTPPPTISASPASLTFTTAPSTTSAAQNVTLVAYGLTAGVTITAPVNFEVFNPATSTWVSSFTLANSTAALGTYINTTVQVHFVGPATIGTYTPGNVTFASAGATTRNVSVTGNVVAACSGTPTPGTVSATATTGSCNPYSPTLSTTGTTSTVGITYQWQSSSDNVSYTSVSGATNPTYVPSISGAIYYRALIGCSASGLSATTPGVLFSYTAPPAAITGSSTVCVASTVTLSSATGGGAWTTSAGSIATVTSGGVVTGVAPGTANITYTASGCAVVQTIAVNNAPAVITITPSSSATVCLGNGSAFTAATTVPATVLLNQDFNSGMGSWAITNTSGVAASFWQIRTPPGYSGDINGDGTPYIEAAPDAVSTNTTTIFTSPSFSTVGFTGATLTYNQFFESWSTDNTVAVQYSINGGTSWTNLVNQLGTDDLTYTWTAATPQKTISLPAAAIGQANVKLRWNYNSVWGFWWAVDNIKVTGTSSVTYAWTGPTGLSCTTCTNPTITPTVTGSNIYTITATATASGCTRAGNVTVSVNPLPVAITGTAAVCQGLTTTLADATPGGTWISGSVGIATVGSNTGIVTGVANGNSTITYTVTSTGCRITGVVTVNPLPASITGTATACVNATTTLSDATGTGTWSSGTAAIATIGSSSGAVTGVSAGLALVTYTLPTSCLTTAQVTINPLPATTITPATAATICLGTGAPFTAFAPQPAFNILLQDFNSVLGSWTVVNTSGTAASYWQITSTPTTGISGDGSPMLEANSDAAFSSGFPLATILVSPSFSTVGYGTATVSFNEYLISAPTDANVDVDYSINGGTTWTNLSGQVGVGYSLPGGGTGSWSSTSTPEVTISLPAGALGQPNVKLRWNYNSNAGLYWDIDNIKVTAYQPAVTYAWTGIAGATGLSCSACGATTITPTATGANVYSVTSTTSAGCQSTTGVTVSVNPLPANIGGTQVVCVNSATTLTDGSGGGTWSSSDPTVSVGASTGIVTGVTAGTAIVSYALPTGCAKTAIVTVNPLPGAITGVMQVCEGLTTTLSSTTSGGTWSSSVPAAAGINATTGVVSGVAVGTTVIGYTLATGCAVSATVTVNHTPAAINGTMQVCEGAQTTLSDIDALGTWASGTATVATIGAGTGVVSGVLGGTSIITYQLPTGCTSTAVVTVNITPAAITGTMQVCEGLTTTLSSATPAGTWSSSASSTATIGSTTGIVSGVAFGTADIGYTLATGCAVSTTVTVNHTPAAITGGLQVCEGLQTTLADIDASGTWASSALPVATIDATTGIVSAVAAGNTTITYQLPQGCIATADLTVNPLPAAITGYQQVCEGLTTSLDDITATGTWSSSAVYASVDASGVVTGGTAGIETITYQLPTTCLRTADVTVNPTPAVITGTMEVCEGLTTALADADAGGTWSTTSGAATVDVNTGVVSGTVAGIATITYQLPTTCINTADVTVNPLPAAITGALQVCEGLTTTLTNASPGGTWSSSALGVAPIDGGGVVLAFSAGVTTITYTLPTGCIMTAEVTVNPLPAAITGNLQVCEGLTTTLANSTGGGVWSSGTTSVADIDAAGVVSASIAGNTTITYTLPTSCISTAVVTVNPLPAAIGGTRVVCKGLTTVLTDADPGGTWSSASIAVASIDPVGTVTGITAGTTAVTYTLPTGCITSSDVTVNPLPAAITGVMQVCEGLATTLFDITSSGTWTSGSTSVADIGVGTGIVAAHLAGLAPVTYTLPTGCLITAQITVNPVPSVIGGALQVCVGLTTSLTNTAPGGTWSTGTPAIAPIGAGTGLASGVTIGSTTVTYTLPTGCMVTDNIIVNPLPAPITGPSQICVSATASFGNGSPGGTWISSTPLVSSIDNTTGVATAMDAGTTVITYTLGTGCQRVRAVTVNPLPAAITGTTQVCQSGHTVLADATAGGTWLSSDATIATVNSAGIVSGIAAGMASVSYKLSTGCVSAAIVTVDPMPAVITGGTTICEGQTTTLANAVAGGSWFSVVPSIASVNTATGEVTGVTAGSAFISYTLPAGCSRAVAVVVNPMPTAVTGAANVCQGATTVMSTASTGGVWTSSTTSVASINLTSGIVTGLGAGTTNISYTLAGSCSVTYTMSVDVMPSMLTGSPALCNGQTTALSSTPAGGTWTSGNIAVAAVGTSGIVSGLAAGTSVISYALSSGCMRSAIITVNALPSVYNVTGGGNYCAGGPGVHIGLDGSNGGVNYQLSSGTGLIGSPVTGVTGLPLDFGFITPAGSYSVTATAASTGCSSNMTGSATVGITAAVPAAVSFNTNTGTDTVCSAGATFTAAVVNGGTIPVYQWKVNSVIVPGATASTYSYVPASGDVVTVNMSSSIACATPTTATAARTLAVTASVMPVAGLAVTPGTNLCQGNTATFSASALFGGTAPVFIWMKNGATATTGSSYTYTPANGDNVYVRLVSNHTCSLVDTVSSSNAIMTVSPLYSPVVNITVDPGTVVQSGTTVTLTAHVTGGGPSPELQWYVGAAAIAGATNSTYSYSVINNGDSVSCQVKGTGACGMSTFNSVIMSTAPAGITVVTPGMGDIRLMPNPNKGEFTVKGTLSVKADKEVAIEVTNMLGQVVYRTSITARNGNIDEQIKLDHTLANGMYMLNMVADNDRKVFHFVVEQ